MLVKFSIITVCYNAQDCIQKTIESVFRQDYNNYEYIIIDGKSTDKTVEIIRECCKSRNVYFISEPDNGIYDAMNKGIKMSTGDYINFLNAGDVYYDSEVLKKFALEADMRNAVIYGDIAVSKYGITAREISELAFGGKDLLMGFNHQGSFVRRDIAQSYLFNMDFRAAADYDMMLRIYRSGNTFQKVNVIVAKYDMSGFSVKQNKLHYKDRVIATYGDTIYGKFLYYKRVFMLEIRSIGRQLFPSMTRKVEISKFMKNKRAM